MNNMSNLNWKDIRTSTAFKLAVVAVVSFVLYSLAGFLFPILLSIALAFVLYPLAKLLTRTGISYAFAVILAVTGFFIGMGVVIYLFVLPIFGQINELTQKLPELINNSQTIDFNAIVQHKSKMPMLPSNFDTLMDSLMQWAMGFAGNFLRDALASSVNVVSSLLGLVVVPFLTIYLLKDWQEMRAMVICFFQYADQEKVAHVIDDIGETISSYVIGLAKLSVISGCVITLGMTLLGVNYPYVLGFWALLAETVPVVGPILGAIPAVFLASRIDTNTAIIVAIFYAVYYQLDSNVLLPKVMGDKIDLHPVVIIASLIIGAKLFGIIGMVFAVPVAAVCRVLYKELWHLGEENA